MESKPITIFHANVDHAEQLLLTLLIKMLLFNHEKLLQLNFLLII
jgi:hypothetical protein